MIAFADNEYLGEQPNPEPVGRLPRIAVPRCKPPQRYLMVDFATPTGSFGVITLWSGGKIISQSTF